MSTPLEYMCVCVIRFLSIAPDAATDIPTLIFLQELMQFCVPMFILPQINMSLYAHSLGYALKRLRKTVQCRVHFSITPMYKYGLGHVFFPPRKVYNWKNWARSEQKISHFKEYTFKKNNSFFLNNFLSFLVKRVLQTKYIRQDLIKVSWKHIQLKAGGTISCLSVSRSGSDRNGVLGLGQHHRMLPYTELKQNLGPSLLQYQKMLPGIGPFPWRQGLSLWATLLPCSLKKPSLYRWGLGLGWFNSLRGLCPE